MERPDSATVKIQCPACAGTGIYSSIYDRDDIAVVCDKCSGTGCYVYGYIPFTQRSRDRDRRIVVPNPNSKIGQQVRTTALDQDTHGLSWAEIGAQRWGIEGTVYDERPATFGGLLYLVGHADGPPVWYGRDELEFVK